MQIANWFSEILHLGRIPSTVLFVVLEISSHDLFDASQGISKTSRSLIRIELGKLMWSFMDVSKIAKLLLTGKTSELRR